MMTEVRDSVERISEAKAVLIIASILDLDGVGCSNFH